MFNNLLDILFLGFSVNLIIACILTITAVNAVGALMALIFAFINATCLFFLMELEFIGLLFLIVYVGAIAVLFLFSVMLFNLKDVVRIKTTSFILTNVLLFLGGAVFFLSLFQNFIIEPIAFEFVELDSLVMTTGVLPNSSLFFVGQIIYNRYMLFLILASIILLIGMIGAVILINNPKISDRSLLQHSLHQVSRTIQMTNMK